jgi:predicted transcriptional regulator
MVNEMVLRSVYLRPSEDSQLRQLAHELNVTKSDLIRSAISVKLRDWLDADDEAIRKDVEHGKRNEAAVRSGRTRVTAIKPNKPKDPPTRSPGKNTPEPKAGKEKNHEKGLAPTVG